MGLGTTEGAAVYPFEKAAGGCYRCSGGAELAKVNPFFGTRHIIAAFTVDLMVPMRIGGRVSVYIIILEHFLLLSGHNMLAFVVGGRYDIYKPQAKDLKPIDKSGAGKVK